MILSETRLLPDLLVSYSPGCDIRGLFYPHFSSSSEAPEHFLDAVVLSASQMLDSAANIPSDVRVNPHANWLGRDCSHLHSADGTLEQVTGYVQNFSPPHSGLETQSWHFGSHHSARNVL